MVGPDGMIAVPSELCGREVDVRIVPAVRCDDERIRTVIDPEEFWRKKSLDEIAAEQDGYKICTNPDDYFGYLEPLWDSPEELEEFLERRKF